MVMKGLITWLRRDRVAELLAPDPLREQAERVVRSLLSADPVRHRGQLRLRGAPACRECLMPDMAYINYTSGEVRALIAPLLKLSSDDLTGVIIVGVPKPGTARSLPVYFDTTDPQQVLDVLKHAVNLIQGEMLP